MCKIMDVFTLIMHALEVVSTHCGVGWVNPCHRGRDVIGSVPTYIRWVSSVPIATASK